MMSLGDIYDHLYSVHLFSNTVFIYIFFPDLHGQLIEFPSYTHRISKQKKQKTKNKPWSFTKHVGIYRPCILCMFYFTQRSNIDNVRKVTNMW
jgi:hypothetical protein